MPMYEYRCACGHKFDVRVPLELRATATCPRCGKVASKIFSAPNWTSTWILDGLTHDEPRRYEDPYVL